MNLLDALYVDHVQQQPSEAKHAASAQRELSSFFEDFKAFEQTLEPIKGDPDLSPEGKKKRIAPLVEDFKAKKEADLQNFERRAQQQEGELAKKATFTPLESDPTLAEARLQSARADARMMLDGVGRDNLARYFAEIAERGGDKALTHLLLTTPWPEHYLRSRGAAGSGWTEDKARLQSLVYGPEAQSALRDLEDAKETFESTLSIMQRHLDGWGP